MVQGLDFLHLVKSFASSSWRKGKGGAGFSSQGERSGGQEAKGRLEL